MQIVCWVVWDIVLKNTANAEAGKEVHKYTRAKNDLPGDEANKYEEVVKKEVTGKDSEYIGMLIEDNQRRVYFLATNGKRDTNITDGKISDYEIKFTSPVPNGEGRVHYRFDYSKENKLKGYYTIKGSRNDTDEEKKLLDGERK